MATTPTTPVKSVINWSFSPKELTTPTKDNPGLSKTVFSHVSNLHKFINDWLRIREKGYKLCSCISALKLHECLDDYYPQQLNPLIEGLVEALESLQSISEGVRLISSQMQALAKLQSSAEPVIYTWSCTEISKQIDKILISIEKECQLKAVVTENIGHCRDEKLLEVYISSWEFDVYLDIEETSFLFIEVGLTGLN